MFIKGEYTNTIVIDKSEFICYLKRLDTLDEFNDYLASIKKKHYDATHHCSAFIAQNIKRSSDDGEPSGSAGLPILTTLEKADLINCGAIVVRYFGGKKLGMGGLIRAYGKAVSETLKIASFTNMKLMREYILEIPYSLNDKIERYLKMNTIITDINYDLNIIYHFMSKNDISEEIKEKTKGIAPIYLKDSVIEVDIEVK